MREIRQTGVILLIALVILFFFAHCATNREEIDKRFQSSLNRATSYLQIGDYINALKELAEAQKLKPDSAELHNLMGLAYIGKKEIDKAIEHLQKAIEIDPKYTEARNNLCRAYGAAGKWDEAIKQCEIATKDILYATPHFAYNNLGLAYYHSGQLQKAVDAFKKAIEIAPRFAPSHNNLGMVYYELGELSIAEEELKTAVELFPEYIDAHFLLGKVYMEKGENNRALEEFQTVQKLDQFGPFGKMAKRYVELLQKKAGKESF